MELTKLSSHLSTSHSRAVYVGGRQLLNEQIVNLMKSIELCRPGTGRVRGE